MKPRPPSPSPCFQPLCSKEWKEHKTESRSVLFYAESADKVYQLSLSMRIVVKRRLCNSVLPHRNAAVYKADFHFRIATVIGPPHDGFCVGRR